MKRFKSPGQVQRFLSIHDQIANVFSRRPNQDTAANVRTASSHSPPGPRLPAWRWLRNHVCEGRCSTHRASLYSIDDKLSVPAQEVRQNGIQLVALAERHPTTCKSGFIQEIARAMYNIISRRLTGH
jgi:hypothetical protein